MRMRNWAYQKPKDIQPKMAGYNTMRMRLSKSMELKPGLPPFPGCKESVMRGKIQISTMNMMNAKIL